MQLFISLWSFLTVPSNTFRLIYLTHSKLIYLELLPLFKWIKISIKYVSLSLISIWVLKSIDALLEALNQVFQLSKYCFTAQIHPFACLVKMKRCPLNTHFFFASCYYIKLIRRGPWIDVVGVKSLLTCQAPIAVCGHVPSPWPL